MCFAVDRGVILAVQNGLERFCVKFSVFPAGRLFQEGGHRDKASKKKERALLSSLGLPSRGFGPYSEWLSNADRTMLNHRERTKLDIEYVKVFGNQEPWTCCACVSSTIER